MKKTKHCCEHCRLETRAERLTKISESLTGVLEGRYEYLNATDTKLLWLHVRDLVDILREEGA